MALTRLQIATEICDVVGKKSTAASVSGTALLDRISTMYLNFAQRRIARAYSASELMQIRIAATAVGVKTYPLTTGNSNLGMERVKDIHSVRLIDSENSRTLVCWSQRKLDEVFPRPENFTVQRPVIYSWYGNSLELFRIPDAVYPLWIRYSQWAQDLIADGQYSDFQNKDELLIAAGVLETYLALEEYTDAKIWEGRYLSLLAAAKATDNEEVNWAPEAEPTTTGNAPVTGNPYQNTNGYTEGVTSINASFGDPGDPLYGYGG